MNSEVTKAGVCRLLLTEPEIIFLEVSLKPLVTVRLNQEGDKLLLEGHRGRCRVVDVPKSLGVEVAREIATAADTYKRKREPWTQLRAGAIAFLLPLSAALAVWHYVPAPEPATSTQTRQNAIPAYCQLQQPGSDSEAAPDADREAVIQEYHERVEPKQGTFEALGLSMKPSTESKRTH